MFIGTDAPDISPALLLRAERLLPRNDAIFGPATDGGFWLFGLNKRPGLPPMFENVRWSGPHAMADLRKNLPPGFRVALLPTLQDVDTKEDWKIWSADNLC